MLGMLDTKYLKCVLNVYIFFKKTADVSEEREFFLQGIKTYLQTLSMVSLNCKQGFSPSVQQF